MMINNPSQAQCSKEGENSALDEQFLHLSVCPFIGHYSDFCCFLSSEMVNNID